MTLLQIFFVVSGILLFYVTLDISRRQRFNALHFLVFFFISVGLLVFTVFPGILGMIGRALGISQGAQALVYISIVFLMYFTLLLLSKIETQRIDTTQLVRALAIELSSRKPIVSDMAFVVAAYNEERVISETIDTVRKSGYGTCIVINDGSKDSTRDILATYEKEWDGLIVLNHLKNRGQGAALETGFEYVRRYGASVKYVVTFDADGQHDISEVPMFLDVMEKDEQIEVALGSRFLSGTRSNVPFMRRLVLRLGILFTYVLSDIRLSDTHNGYRMLRKSALSKIRITMDAMEHASEIIDIIATNRIRYVEVPVTITYTDYSVAKGQSSRNAIRIAVRMIWKKFFS